MLSDQSEHDVEAANRHRESRQDHWYLRALLTLNNCGGHQSIDLNPV